MHSNWVDLFLYWESDCSHLLFQIYYVFAEQELQKGDNIITYYDTSLVLGKYILKEVCYLTT